ncbi:hypothetical protein FN846DRAFT_785520, partial [Sphaerosporella brunnea]
MGAEAVEDHVKLDKEAYESTEPIVPVELLEEKLDEPAVDEEAKASETAEDLSQEVKVTPLPASENAENPIQLQPGEPIPDEIVTASTDEHVKLDQKSYESTEPTVSAVPQEIEVPVEDLNREVKVAPLPAFENAENPIQLQPGEPIPEDITTAAVPDHVKLDQESYESKESSVPIAPVEEAVSEPEVKVDPLPAFDGAENPIQLQPGEQIPEGVTTATVHDNVKLDQASYESAASSVP